MILKSKNTIRTVLLLMAMTLSSATFAQDRMAMVAPAAKSIRTQHNTHAGRGESFQSGLVSIPKLVKQVHHPLWCCTAKGIQD